MAQRWWLRRGARWALVSLWLVACDCDGDPVGPCDRDDAPTGCGTSCDDAPCRSGLYCADDDLCTADCMGDADCGDGERCDPEGRCVATTTPGTDFAVEPRDGSTDGCPSATVSARRVTPTVIVIVDQSSSMNQDFGGSSRWDSLRDSLLDPGDGLIATLEDQVRFGLALYSAEAEGGSAGPPIGACPQLTEVRAMVGNYEAIRDVYEAADPIDETPTGDSIDAVLDGCLAQDPRSRVACETLVTTGLVCIAGEISTNAYVDMQKVARDTVRKIGYVDSKGGFDADTCAVVVSIDQQSSDISQGVTEGSGLYKEQGAGDQGLMFGYACDETAELMPTPIITAHQLVKNLADVRRSGGADFLRPDSKSQVTVQYEDGRPKRIDTIVISTQHAAEASWEHVREAVVETVIKPTVDKSWIDRETRILVNPTGRFVVGGPMGDCGLTGRKIIVDTYGGWARHGGGALPHRLISPHAVRVLIGGAIRVPGDGLGNDLDGIHDVV